MTGMPKSVVTIRINFTILASFKEMTQTVKKLIEFHEYKFLLQAYCYIFGIVGYIRHVNVISAGGISEYSFQRQLTELTVDEKISVAASTKMQCLSMCTTQQPHYACEAVHIQQKGDSVVCDLFYYSGP